MKIKKINCMNCGKETFARVKRALCDECRMERKLESERENSQRMKEIRRIMNVQREIHCIICGKRLFNVYPTTKYCNICRRAVDNFKSKKRQREANKEWKTLSDGEQLRRMELVIQKLNHKEEQND